MRTLIRILLRQALANNPSNPRAWLVSQQSALFTSATSTGGDITSSSANGKSVSISVPANFSKKDLLDGYEIAIAFIDRGGDPSIGPSDVTAVNFRNVGSYFPS